MNVFIDGFQGCGKTTLIEKSDYKFNRFPFNQYLDLFGLNTKEDLNGYQLGKDLGILFGLQYNKETVLFDRGPFSSIFYSLKEQRYGDKTSEILMKFLLEISRFQNCKYIFVVKENDFKKTKREHNDGFDYLDDENDPEKYQLLYAMKEAAKKYGIDLIIFTNDFSKSISDNIINFKKLLEDLTNEYNRN